MTTICVTNKTKNYTLDYDELTTIGDLCYEIAKLENRSFFEIEIYNDNNPADDLSTYVYTYKKKDQFKYIIK